MNNTRTYSYYRSIFQNHSLPLAFVDLDLFDLNLKKIVDKAQGKKIRIASKSIRCRWLIEYILKQRANFNGIMSYSIPETTFLCEEGFENILVAYPSCQKNLLRQLLPYIKDKKIVLMIDSEKHLGILQELGQEADVVFSVCLDVDMSTSYPGIHFGVFRSPLNEASQVVALSQKVEEASHVRFSGIMGYEAQIAGLGELNPVHPRPVQWVLKSLKKHSIKQVAKKRAQVLEALKVRGSTPSLVNGGGTGSLAFTSQEEGITEVTAGSGFFSPVLFDYYTDFSFLPAAAYAIEITRHPTSQIFTCHGGGFVASGSAGKDKLPLPYLPLGATLLKNEGAGEVQTPVYYKGKENLTLGDPIFMRHSKAGELCEHFKTLYLLREGKIVEKVPTYRGEGKCFL